MDRTKGIDRKARSGPTGIGRHLVGSAAWHLLGMACLLLWPAGAAVRVPQGIAEVLLVDAGSPSLPAAEAPPGASAKGSRRMPDAGPREYRVPPRISVPGEDLPVPVVPLVPTSGAAGIPSARVESVPLSAGPAPGSVPAAVFPANAPPRASLPVDSTGKAGGDPGNGVEQRNPEKEALPEVRLDPPLVSAAGGGGDRGTAGEGVVRLLRERIESRISYPEEAARRGQEGMVVLRIRIGEGGIPNEIRVARSSGARILDEAARTGVVRASPLPSIPGWFEVPVRFVLR